MENSTGITDYQFFKLFQPSQRICKSYAFNLSWYPTMVLMALIWSLYGCQEKVDVNQVQDVSFQTAIYYPSFLFMGERSDTLTKTLKYEFNAWAKDQNSNVLLGVYDDKENLIDASNNRLSLLINGKPNTSGKIELDSQKDSEGGIKISMLFAPNEETIAHRGYIKVLQSDLDRINHISDLKAFPILSWSATQQVIWNPLKKYLIIGLLVLLAILLFWLFFLGPIVFSRFGRGALTIQSPAFKNIRLHKSIGLTLSDHSIRQNWKERFFKGKELNYSNPLFPAPIRITPQSKNKIRIQLGPAYSIQPFTTTLNKGGGQYIITNLNTKDKITITYG